jgi:colanic acid biosynthesis glycosyl transferase WcaI
VFVGGGVEVERLKARVAAESIANAVFLPRLPMSEIGRVLHAADALLVHLKDDPLFAITVPSKTQAYMAVGRPVIMAVRGDAARLVQTAGAGLVVEPEQPEALAAAVLELAAMPPARRAALGSDGAAYYRRELSLASGAQKFEALFRRAIQDHAEEHAHVAHHA